MKKLWNRLLIFFGLRKSQEQIEREELRAKRNVEYPHDLRLHFGRTRLPRPSNEYLDSMVNGARTRSETENHSADAVSFGLGSMFDSSADSSNDYSSGHHSRHDSYNDSSSGFDSGFGGGDYSGGGAGGSWGDDSSSSSYDSSNNDY
ncbi:hypothetical protein [Flavobacterium psychrotrophum]|uniref:hypothetical protein n=1 Tax=Flavobacterium psychrotrophum TaxID=2294119 RepID=UPI000E30BFE4|nr:hypothetical protein [Flavobacterium psychrotrophum]